MLLKRCTQTFEKHSYRQFKRSFKRRLRAFFLSDTSIFKLLQTFLCILARFKKNMRFCLNIIRKILIRVTSSKRYQNVRSDLTILGPFANVTLTLCVSWDYITNCVSHQNTCNYSLSAMDYNNYIDSYDLGKTYT